MASSCAYWNVDFAYHLEVRDADIEGFVHIGMPHHTHVGDIHDAQVALETKTVT